MIRGSAVNQDGAAGTGSTAPNGGAQQRVIGDALKRRGRRAGATSSYLEAHGTGTSLGDPIEAQAAGAAFGAGREPDQPLSMGSAKTNIGHLEAAAGIAGVIKVVLSLENELLPQHLHFENPSPHIPWDRLAVEVVKEARAWERNGRLASRVSARSASQGRTRTSSSKRRQSARRGRFEATLAAASRFSILRSRRGHASCWWRCRRVPRLGERAPGGRPWPTCA